jgi:hypothetical protein
MLRNRPYQPLLLRLLHGVNGLLIIGAIITGFLVYNTYDGRWGKLPIPHLSEIQDIHGTIAVTFFLIFPAFALYSFHSGEKRLLQPDSVKNLGKINQQIGWYSWHRLVNTLMLIAAILAAFSGRTMKEEWLPNGELNHPGYYLHLFSWLVMLLCLVFHLLMVAKVGGLPLIVSMFNWQVRPQDSPRHWKANTLNWLQKQKSKFTQK